MASLKLIRQISVLTAAEKRELRRWLVQKNTPQNAVVGKLLDYLLLQEPGTAIDRQSLSAVIFPGQTYNAVRIRDLISQLSRQLEAMLMQQSLILDKPLAVNLLLAAYGQRAGCYELFREESFRLLNKLEQQPDKGMHEYARLHRLCHDLYFHPETDKYELGSLLLLQKALRYEKLGSQLCREVYEGELAVRQQLLQSPDRYPFNTTDSPPASLQLLLDCRQLGQTVHTAESFRQLFDRFQEQQQQLPSFEAHIIFKMMLNFAGRRATAGDESFIWQLHQLHLYGLSNHYFIEWQQITSIRFSNIVVAALMAGQEVWVKLFMDTHYPFLPASERDYTLHWCQALLLYQQAVNTREVPLYEQSLTLLQQIPYNNGPLDLRLRSLQIRLGYDYHFLLLNDAHLPESWMRNFERHLWKSQLLTQNRKNGYLLFIRLVRKIMRLQQRHATISARQKQRLLQIAEQSDGIYFIGWLRLRIQAL